MARKYISSLLIFNTGRFIITSPGLSAELAGSQGASLLASGSRAPHLPPAPTLWTSVSLLKQITPLDQAPFPYLSNQPLGLFEEDGDQGWEHPPIGL